MDIDVNVNIQAAELAEAISKLADALSGIDLASTTDLTVSNGSIEPENPKKRTRKSRKASTQDNQAPVEPVAASNSGQPVTAAPVSPVAPPVNPVPPTAPQPSYWPQATADGKIVQVPMPPFNNPAPTPAPPVASPVYAAPAPVQAPPLQTAGPSYTVEQLGVAAMPLMDAGRQGELLQLLAHFGVQSVQELPKERYAEFAMALRQLGAKI
jgi:hypothetical protein